MKASSAYSDMKPAWHIDSMKTMRSGGQPVPPHLQLIISDLCNQDCHFCAYRISDGFSSANFGEILESGVVRMNPHRMIPIEKIKEILSDAKQLGVKAIQFTGGGEPTVHPDHLEAFAYAQGLGLETALVTNGVILREGWKDTLPSMAWIRVSLDAGSPESYAAIRRTSSATYAKVLLHIAEIADAIKDKKCLLGVGFVVTPENYRGIVTGVQAAADTGAAYVRLSASFTREYDAPYREIYPMIRGLIAEARSKCESDSFSVVDLFGNRLEDLRQHAPDYEFCGYQYLNTYVGGDQKVYRCCNTAYTDRGLVGDLNDQSLQGWFFGMQKYEAYKNFDARGCEVCQFNGKNKVINEITGEGPLHGNFV